MVHLNETVHSDKSIFSLEIYRLMNPRARDIIREV